MTTDYIKEFNAFLSSNYKPTFDIYFNKDKKFYDEVISVLKNEQSYLIIYEAVQIYKNYIYIQDKFCNNIGQFPFDITNLIYEFKEKSTSLKKEIKEIKTKDIKSEMKEKSTKTQLQDITDDKDFIVNENHRDLLIFMILHLIALIIRIRSKHDDSCMNTIISLIWNRLNSTELINNRLSYFNIRLLFEKIYNKIQIAIIQPGEPIGIITATSISSILTQLTLNSFHHSGVGGKTGQDLSMKTFYSVLRVSKKPSIDSVYNKIFFKEQYAKDEEFVRDIIKLFQTNNIADFIISKDKLYDQNFFTGETVYKKDVKLLQKYLKDISDSGETGFINYLSILSIRLEFSKQKMFDKRVKLESIIAMLYKNYDFINIIRLSENIIRIYVDTLQLKGNYKNELEAIENIYDDISTLSISGIAGIQTVELTKNEFTYYDPQTREIKKDWEWILYTIGYNLIEVFDLPFVDTTRTFSNELNEVYAVLGKEAARTILFESIINIIRNNGEDINTQFVHLQVDNMTHNGGMIVIGYEGMSKVEKMEPLQKISYERPEQFMFEAGINGTKDNFSNIFSNIMVTQEGPYSGGLSTILQNRDKLV